VTPLAHSWPMASKLAMARLERAKVLHPLQLTYWGGILPVTSRGSEKGLAPRPQGASH